MSIKFDKEYNKEIHDTVRYANARIKRLGKHGVHIFDSSLKVRDLKYRYKKGTKADLDRELRMLRKLTVKEGLKKTTNAEGVSSSRWQKDYYMMNRQKAIAYYESRYEKLSSRIKEFPGKLNQLNAIGDKIALLKKVPETMTKEELRSYNATMKDYFSYPAIRRGGYRGFLSEVDLVMERLGYDEATRDGVFKKLSKLDIDQFQEMYDDSDLVERIYDLADSPKYKHAIIINTSTKKAKSLVDDFISQIDELVAKYKEY